MVIHGAGLSAAAVSLRIVPPPPESSVSSEPGYVAPAMFVNGAGRLGLMQNAAEAAAQPALFRTLHAATGSPNAVTPVGSAGTAGLPGAVISSQIKQIPTPTAISGAAAPLQPSTNQQRKKWPSWAFVAIGLAAGWVVFHG